MEVLREVAASVHADYFHYMDRNGINHGDLRNSVALLARDTFNMKDEIINDCDTLDDLNIIAERLQESRKFIEGLIEDELQAVS